MFLGGRVEKVFASIGFDSAPDENSFAPLKMEFAPDEKNPGHASAYTLVIFSKKHNYLDLIFHFIKLTLTYIKF